MKKILNKFLLLVLSVLMVTGVFAGCKGGSSSDIDPSKITNPVFVMNHFDDYRDLWRWIPSKTFGDISLNKDSDYIKEGEGSAKITIIANPTYLAGEKSNSKMTAQTKDVLDYRVYGNIWSDFAYVTLVSIDVYNPGNVTRKVAIQLHYSETTASIPLWIECAPGWNTVSCPIQREFIPYTKIDNNSAPAPVVNHISIHFEKDYSADYVLYVDNMCIFYATDEVLPAEISLKEDEICSFDEYWQYKKFSITCYTPGYIPEAEWMQFPEEPERGGVLKVTTVDRSSDTSGSDYPGIKIPEETYSMFFNDENFDYDDNDLFCVDIKGPATNMIQCVYFELYYNDTSKFTTKSWKFEDEETGRKPGEWQTIAFTVAEMNTNRYTTYPWIDGKQEAVDHVTYADARTGFFKDCKKINMTYKSAASYISEEIYIDNFRMVRVD